MEYEYRVYAENIVGIGKASKVSEGYIARDPCDPPGTPEAIKITKDSVTIVWTKPEYDGGAKVTGYIVEKKELPEGRWLKANFTNVIETEYLASGLVEGNQYEFRVVARNAAGVFSIPSYSTGPITARDEIEPPRISIDPEYTQNIVVTAGDNFKIDADVHGKPLVCAINKVGVGEHADVAGIVVAKDRADEPDLDIDPELRKIVTIKAGASLRLFIPIKGRPTPTIKWDKDEASLKETAQVEITSSYTLLVIDKMSRNDSGKYTVSAENSSGTKSAFVVVRVLDTPSAPVNLKVKEITNQSVTLEWEPPLLDGGSKIKNYIVEKRESTRKTFAAVVTNCHALSWQIEPLQEGCSYYFRVLAENAYGVGLPAATVDPLKVSEVPQAPKSLIVTDQTKTSISVAWERPEYDGGSRVMQYLLEVQLKGQEKWSAVNTFKTMEATVPNLNPGEEYLFRVTAVNDKGKSDPKVLSGPVMTKNLVFEPDVRPEFSSYSVHVGKDINIDIPIFGRPKPTITWTKDGAPLKFTTRVHIVNTPTHTTLSIKEAAGDDGGMYSINVANSPLESGAVIMKTPFVLPGPPHIEDVSNIAHDGMTISWSAPETDGGSEITNYIIEKKDRTGIKWTRCNRQKVTDLSFRVTGLTTGHEYEFRVAAENIVGVGEPSLASSYYKACDPKYKPGAPGYVHVIDSTKTSITVSWGKPLSDGGSVIQGYIVEVCKAEEEEWIMVTPPTGLRVNKYEITKLTEGQEYKIQVCALNKLGVGEPAVLSGTAKPEERVEPPEIHLDSELRKGIVLKAGGSVRINIPFKGRPTPEIKWTKDDGNLTEKPVVEKAHNFTQLSIDSCDRSDSGKYTLTLTNSSGTVSEFVSVKILDAPGAPQNLVVKEIRKDSITLAWDAPLIDGGAKIKNYVIDKRESTRKAYANVSTKCTKTTFKVENLIEGAMYYFRVMAENEYGIGPAVETKTASKASEVPLPVGKVFLTDVTKSSVSLAWEKPEQDGGSRIAGYLIEMQPKGTDKWGPKALAAPVIATDMTMEPSIKIPFNTYSVLAGKDLKLEFPVLGKPKPKITWAKDGQPLKVTSRMNIISTSATTGIEITEASKEDFGKYTITAANTTGTIAEDVSV
uniref:Titin n=1 Tax=Oreochromis niloticus TaxID=8128 RepID=A0A669D936_ORENI